MRGLCAVALVVWLGGAAAAEVMSLTRDQAIGVARQAWLAGDVPMAFAIATRISEDDPRDSEALLLLSACRMAMGQGHGALRLAKRAWVASGTKPPDFRAEIATQAGAAAFSLGRKRLAMGWLQRAVALAEGPAQHAARQDLARVGSEVPLRFSGRLVVSPTDNLNDGASSGLWSVDDFVIGGLSGWSVAHAGTVAEASVGAEIAWDASGQGRYILGMGLAGQFHQLSAQEARENPGLEASDLDMTRVSLSWRHEKAGEGRMLGVEASKTWFGGQAYSTSMRLSAELALPVTKAEVSLQGVAERQWTEAGSRVDGLSLQLRTERDLALGWGEGKVEVTLGGTFLHSDEINTTYDRYDLAVWLDPALPLGQVQSRFGLNIEHRAQEDYVLFGNVHASNGRTDDGVTLRAAFGLERAAVAGLVPTLMLQRKVTRSNISKYQGDAAFVSFGLAARF